MRDRIAAAIGALAFWGSSLALPGRAAGGDPAEPCSIRNGDVNADGVLDISDPILTLSFLFGNGIPPSPAVVADASCVTALREQIAEREAQLSRSQADLAASRKELAGANDELGICRADLAVMEKAFDDCRAALLDLPPFPGADAAKTLKSIPVAIAVLANDSDPDGDPLSVTAVTSPANGTATIQPEGSILYAPEPSFVGTDRFTYTVSDGFGKTAAADVSVEVADAPKVILPRSSIHAGELGVIVNDDDPQSVEVAAYYSEKRSIPDQNIVHLRFPPGTSTLGREAFAPLKAAVDAALGPAVQALVLTWTQPFRVDCMSVTSAFALGFDTKYCSTPCSPTAFVDYYGSESLRPYTDFGIRPAMALAGTSVAEVKALIDRGIAADDTFPEGTGWLVRTTDTLRSVRFFDFQTTVLAWDREDGLDLRYVDNSPGSGSGSNSIEGQAGILFYLTGLASVPGIATNTYRPGAVADHVTSYGGILIGSGQMSALRWLEAGATASYGTVVEPCNYTAKFPAASILIPCYFRGGTVIEAYWKSVAWPGEGIFVGEPLARPWGKADVEYEDRTLTIRLTWLNPSKTYELRAADSEEGPFTPVLAGISIPHHQRAEIVLPEATNLFYRLVETGSP